MLTIPCHKLSFVIPHPNIFIGSHFYFSLNWQFRHFFNLMKNHLSEHVLDSYLSRSYSVLLHQSKIHFPTQGQKVKTATTLQSMSNRSNESSDLPSLFLCLGAATILKPHFTTPQYLNCDFFTLK